MKLTAKYKRKYPPGIWIALVALLLTCLAWIMQMYSLINWEKAVRNISSMDK